MVSLSFICLLCSWIKQYQLKLFGLVLMSWIETVDTGKWFICRNKLKSVQINMIGTNTNMIRNGSTLSSARRKQSYSIWEQGQQAVAGQDLTLSWKCEYSPANMVHLSMVFSMVKLIKKPSIMEHEPIFLHILPGKWKPSWHQHSTREKQTNL